MSLYVKLDTNGSPVEVLDENTVIESYGIKDSYESDSIYKMLLSAVPRDGYNKKQGVPQLVNDRWVQTWINDDTPEDVYAERTRKESLEVRKDRDALIKEVMWKYERNARETRMGIPQTDSIEALDNYVQTLTDIPQQDGFPWNVKWPRV